LLSLLLLLLWHLLNVLKDEQERWVGVVKSYCVMRSLISHPAADASITYTCHSHHQNICTEVYWWKTLLSCWISLGCG
jgi:hypothetical protein